VSEKRGEFLDERDFEWSGNDVVNAKLWMGSPRKWRESVGNKEKGAFEGLKVLIYGKTVPEPQVLRNVIEISGGHVVALKPPYKGI
jgi:hypothetical protein